MARINKLEKLINKMTDDMDKNIILVSKKMSLINSMNDVNWCVLDEIMYQHRDEIKVMNFIKAYFYNLTVEQDVNFLNLFTFNSNSERLIYNLRINGLIVEEDFVKKYRDICCHYGEKGLSHTGEPLIIELNDIVNDIQKFINIDSIDYFMIYWVEAIINQRKDSINLDEGPITVLETITALNYMVTNYQNENIVNEDKNKILTHIANITK